MGLFGMNVRLDCVNAPHASSNIVLFPVEESLRGTRVCLLCDVRHDAAGDRWGSMVRSEEVR